MENGEQRKMGIGGCPATAGIPHSLPPYAEVFLMRNGNMERWNCSLDDLKVPSSQVLSTPWPWLSLIETKQLKIGSLFGAWTAHGSRKSGKTLGH